MERPTVSDIILAINDLMKENAVDALDYADGVNLAMILTRATQYANGLTQEDVTGICDEPQDIDSDCGFDPYMGCFTEDC